MYSWLHKRSIPPSVIPPSEVSGGGGNSLEVRSSGKITVSFAIGGGENDNSRPSAVVTLTVDGLGQ